MKIKNGQVLVAFLLILPIILVVLVLVIESGINYTEKRKINNVIKTSINYYFKNIDDENIENKIENLIIKNIDNIDYKEINITNNYINIIINKKNKSLFPKIIKQQTYKLKSNYEGYISDDKLIIKRIEG